MKSISNGEGPVSNHTFHNVSIMTPKHSDYHSKGFSIQEFTMPKNWVMAPYYHNAKEVMAYSDGWTEEGLGRVDIQGP